MKPAVCLHVCLSICLSVCLSAVGPAMHFCTVDSSLPNLVHTLAAPPSCARYEKKVRTGVHLSPRGTAIYAKNYIKFLRNANRITTTYCIANPTDFGNDESHVPVTILLPFSFLAVTKTVVPC